MLTEIDRQKIYYEVFGSGKKILFLHGWGGSGEGFYYVANILSHSFQVFLVDLPGFGRSELPKQTFGTLDYAETINKLLKKLGIDKIIVAGHSFGGRVALAIAATDPIRKRVEKLILIDSEGVLKKSPKTRLLIVAYKMAKKILPTPLVKRLKSRIGSRDYVEAGPLQNTLIKIVNEDLNPLLSKITAPTLIIWGEDDEVTSLKCAKTLSERVKNSRLEVLKNAGHFPFLDKPNTFCQLIKGFVYET